jgi:hypothetical protein
MRHVGSLLVSDSDFARGVLYCVHLHAFRCCPYQGALSVGDHNIVGEIKKPGAERVESLHYLQNVKEHATLSAGASVDHGVGVETAEKHGNRAADRGCCVSSCSPWLVCFGRVFKSDFPPPSHFVEYRDLTHE